MVVEAVAASSFEAVYKACVAVKDSVSVVVSGCGCRARRKMW